MRAILSISRYPDESFEPVLIRAEQMDSAEFWKLTEELREE